MKKDFRNIFKQLHLWVSVPFGLAITVICFTGAMLVFEKEITALCTAEIRSVEPKGAPLPLGVLAEKVACTLPDDVKVTGISVPASDEEAYKVNLSKPRRAAVYVDQYTGEIKGRSERLPFFNVMFRMHRWLMDSQPKDGGIFWGKMIVGASTLAFVAILITGLVVWLPRNRKSLRNRLKIVAAKGWQRFWYDLHVAGGFYALLLLLAMSLTGLTWSFQWYRNGFYNVFGIETQQNTQVGGKSDNKKDGKGNEARKERKEKAGNPYEYWQEAYDAVMAKESEFKQITVSDGSISVSRGGFGNQRASDKYIFDKRTGKITGYEPYSENAPSSKMRGWIYSVHAGTWGGVFTQVLYFLAAMLGATLPLTGYYLWIKRLLRKRKRQ
ncbi:MAG: PepSY domain-containing protein [Bacteroidaceae bacterium]|nr:PepSY domain-containing protein [Bacteroidaceae bacterium]